METPGFHQKFTIFIPSQNIISDKISYSNINQVLFNKQAECKCRIAWLNFTTFLLFVIPRLDTWIRMAFLRLFFHFLCNWTNSHRILPTKYLTALFENILIQFRCPFLLFFFAYRTVQRGLVLWENCRNKWMKWSAHKKCISVSFTLNGCLCGVTVYIGSRRN